MQQERVAVLEGTVSARLPRPHAGRVLARLQGLTRLVPLLVLLLLGSGCATNPATGRYQFKTLSREEEIQLGQEAMPALVQEYGGTYPSPALSAYVTEVGMKLAAQVEDPQKASLPWEFTVLDSEVINAFALPGGKVFISVGLLREFTCEAQLAGVLGHEVGHVTADHAEQRMGQATTVQVLGQVVGAAASIFGGDPGIAQAAGLLVGSGGQGFLLKFSRDQESEADALGIRYMVRAGYDPQGLLDVMQILKAASEADRSIEMLSTHPYPETRLKRVAALLQSQYPDAVGNPSLTMGCAEWQARAMPTLPARARTAIDPGQDGSRLASRTEPKPRPAAGAAVAAPACSCGFHRIMPASVPPA